MSFDPPSAEFFAAFGAATAPAGIVSDPAWYGPILARIGAIDAQPTSASMKSASDKKERTDPSSEAGPDGLPGGTGVDAGDGTSLESGVEATAGLPHVGEVPDIEGVWQTDPLRLDETASTAPADGEDFRERDFSPLLLRDRVTIMLLFREKVHADHVEAAWNMRRRDATRIETPPLWRYLLLQKGVDREAVFAEAAEVYAFPKASVTPQQAIRFIEQNRYVFTDAQWEEMRRTALIPVARENVPQTNKKRWIFGSHDPTRPEVAILLRRLHLDFYDVQYVSEAFTSAVSAAALRVRNEYLDRINRAGITRQLGATFDKPDLDDAVLEAEIAGSALVNLFEAMLVEGVRQGASDVHVFVSPARTIEIHFRIDGHLTLWRVEQRTRPEAFLAVVKDNAVGIDRFERDTAQDGFIERTIDDVQIRFRVSVLPLATSRNEERFDSIVIRILDDRKAITDLGLLGFEGDARRQFEWAVSEPYGMIIITGPTGSGKTTSLYAALARVVDPKRNVLSVEDPVEYLVPGVRQVKLSHKFRVQDAIRSIVRHDPDVVMVGEMRDRETADLAITLANTGHLTFSTLHTNDAASAVIRLYNMGIEPFLIANALTLVVSQRLVRVLCTQCRAEEPEPDPLVLGRIGLTVEDFAGATLYRAGSDKECAACGGAGYRGRRAVMEVLPVTEEIRRLILVGGDIVDEDAIRELAVMQGMTPLLDAALNLVRSGITSLEEAMTVGIGRAGGGQRSGKRCAEQAVAGRKLLKGNRTR